MQEGIEAERVKVFPLAFEPRIDSQESRRGYPKRFTRARPLRVLFLGQVNLRKGAVEILDAADRLRGQPVEFWFVGPVQLDRRLVRAANVRWFGSVPRGRVGDFYRDADVFLFPTHSDGFGLTQLEAQAWGLPMIASRNCAPVVEDGWNGILLNKVSAVEIVEAIGLCLGDPSKLAIWSGRAVPTKRHGLDRLGHTLLELAGELECSRSTGQISAAV
jgi:glycosyltransferase involved in cell wall biosynthesis